MWCLCFFKQKTAYEMRISDWSSDVCSSDLGDKVHNFSLKKPNLRWSIPEKRPKRKVFLQDISRTLPLDASAGYARVAKLSTAEISTDEKIGRASCRERVCQYV